MINEGGDVSMLYQITKKEGMVSLVWKRHSHLIFLISQSTLKMCPQYWILCSGFPPLCGFTLIKVTMHSLHMQVCTWEKVNY